MPLIRSHDAWHDVAAAGLEQQYADIRVLGESARYHRSGRARSANDKVVLRLQFSGELLLIHMHSLNEIRRLSPHLKSAGVFLEFHQFSRVEGVKTRFTDFTESAFQ